MVETIFSWDLSEVKDLPSMQVSLQIVGHCGTGDFVCIQNDCPSGAMPATLKEISRKSTGEEHRICDDRQQDVSRRYDCR